MNKKVLISLLMTLVFGVFTTVNAESYVASSAPDTFTTRAVGHAAGDSYGNPDNDAVLANLSLTRDAETQVIDYHTTDNQKIFCINRTKDYPFASTVYTKKGVSSDKVIPYIIGLSNDFYQNDRTLNSGILPENVDVPIDLVNKYQQSWLTQMAVWRYQNTANFNSIGLTTTEIFEDDVYSPTRPSDYYTYSRMALTLDGKARTLVEAAKAAAKESSDNTFILSFDGNYVVDKEAKTIKTGLITTANSSMSSIDISKAPKGTKVYASGGEEVNPSDMTLTPQFYLEIPIDNVENYAIDFDITATATGAKYYEGYEYESANPNDQPLILVVEAKKDLNGTLHFEKNFVEDTSSIIATSIYFVGFMILIAGLGVIYINVKPKKAGI